MPDLDEIEKALLHAALGLPPSYHTLGYAWDALKRCGYEPRTEVEEQFAAARDALISTDKTP